MRSSRLWIWMAAIAACLGMAALLYAAGSPWWVPTLVCGILAWAVVTACICIGWKRILKLPPTVGEGILKGEALPERSAPCQTANASVLLQRLEKAGFAVCGNTALRGKERFAVFCGTDREGLIAFAEELPRGFRATVVALWAESAEQARSLSRLCGTGLAVAAFFEGNMYWTEGLAPLAGGSVHRAVKLAKRYGLGG